MAQYPDLQSAYEPATVISGSASAAGLTTIGTPPANRDLRRLLLDIPEDSTTGSAGQNQIQVLLNNVVIFTTHVYMGTTGGGTGGALWQENISFEPLDINSGTGTLQINIQTALTAGEVNVNAYFD